MIARAAFALAVLFMLPFTGNGETSELNGIRYNVRQAQSRVTFRFNGTVAYSARKSDTAVTLVFRNVSVGSPPGEARLNFVSGGVRGVDLRRVGRDSAVATIRLRNNSRVEYSSSEDGHALYVDVLGGQQRPSVPAGTGKSALSTKKENVRAAMPPTSAEAVANGSEGEEQVSMRSEQAQSPAGRQDASETGMMIAILLSLIVSAAGTSAILWFYVRQSDGSRVGDLRSADTPVQESAPDNFSLPRLSVSPAHPQGSTVRSLSADMEVDDPGLTLAERFQRSRSELDFAIQLSSIPYPNGLGKELTATDAASLSGAQRTVVAKKLGVGRGELDLMANLSKMKEQAKEGNHD